jgi:hypothetical protein
MNITIILSLENATKDYISREIDTVGIHAPKEEEVSVIFAAFMDIR